MKAFASVVLFLTGCAATSSFTSSSSSSRASGADSSGTVTIPNVFKLRKQEAIAALRRAGVQGDINDDGSMCGSFVDGKIIEIGEVCYQFPAAGRVQGARLVVSLRVQTDDPRHGNIGKNTEWYLMPNLIGMTFEQALAEMHRAGFAQDDRVQHVWADETTTCKPNVVCRQYPDVNERAGLNDGKILYFGQERRPTVTGSDTPPPPTTTTATTPPAPTTTSTTTTTTSTTSTPSKPATPPSPPATTTTAANDKHYGGNGSPPYRDSHNAPHGPGGPVYMGRGEPCTNKIDHCLRPGVWFAADNVVAGSLFRGTPVFELEGKWWTWRGDEAEYKFLFKTKVADKVAEVEVGKPVLFFVEEGGRKWLDNEYDMLTSSRWSLGVVDAATADAITIRGWGPVSLESIRVIVEKKERAN
ncbi:MAG TPA: hypothetical protein VFV99_02245 [Kofleriaceae bacterium]|nr:hypothetical protein [Kofleriaceae bacterium]